MEHAQYTCNKFIYLYIYLYKKTIKHQWRQTHLGGKIDLTVFLMVLDDVLSFRFRVTSCDMLESELSKSGFCFASSIRIFIMSPILRPTLRRSSSLAARRVSKSSICVSKSVKTRVKSQSKSQVKSSVILIYSNT